MATTLTSKPLEWFKPDPNQPRKSFDKDELMDLGESLKKKQHHPLLSRLDGTITDGHRRFFAGELVGLKQLDVIITDEPMTPAQVKEIQL